MNPTVSASTEIDEAQLSRIQKGLRMLTVSFPYLSGLAAATRVSLDARVQTMGVFASGRLVANGQFVARLKDQELVFVLAHEMFHLALRTNDRAKGSSRLEFNYAHDYIINDILRDELGTQKIPAHGLDMPGARARSAEEIVLEMRKNQAQQETRSRVWNGEAISLHRVFGSGQQRRQSGAKKLNDNLDEAGDVLDDSRERELFPEEAGEQKKLAEKIRQAAAKGLALAKVIGSLRGVRGIDSGSTRQVVSALRGLYRTPWEVALQRWLESVAPSERSFSRPSRRGAERKDLVLPGRRRAGWTLNIVLDTSGSMTRDIPRILGALADFCDATAVDQVRLVQCDAEVIADELLAPAELGQWEIGGYGGSDLSPAMNSLADDPQVRAVLVVTDGDIELPSEAMPYHVLWVLPAPAAPVFRPPYGQVVVMQAS